jgi:hypothetical protein
MYSVNKVIATEIITTYIKLYPNIFQYEISHIFDRAQIQG